MLGQTDDSDTQAAIRGRADGDPSIVLVDLELRKKGLDLERNALVEVSREERLTLEFTRFVDGGHFDDRRADIDCDANVTIGSAAV